MRAHRLWGGREGLDWLHHGLRGHDRCPGIVEGDGEGHLHDAVGDGDDGSRWVHDGHLCGSGCNVHVQTVLLVGGEGGEVGERGRKRDVSTGY